MKELTLRQKIAQTVILEIRNSDENSYYERLYEQIIKEGIGGIFVGGEIIDAASASGEKAQAFIRRVMQDSPIPLIVCADTEFGGGAAFANLTKLPHAMALGATSNPSLAYDYGKATALESVAMGINMSLSPVVDLLMNPQNGLVGVRSVGDDPERALPLLSGMVRGMQENGMAACIKHFPGDGVDWRNQHFVTSENTLSMEEWNKKHGRVFRTLIEEGANAVMVGHIALPAYQTERKNGRCLPGTQSREIITDLLKGELGFSGIVMSDALNMGGYLGRYPTYLEHDVASVKAGIDMMLWPHEGYIDRIFQAVQTGEIPEERLNDAANRILATKERMGLFRATASVDLSKATEFAQKVACEIAEQSLTLRVNHGILPLKKDTKKILLLPITDKPYFLDALSPLKKGLEARGIRVDVLTDYWLKEITDTDYDYHLYVAGGGFRLGDTKLSFPPIWASLCMAQEKSVVISMSSPYFYEDYFFLGNAEIDTYSDVPSAQEAVLKALFGEIDCPGTVPVQLS